MGRPRRDGRAHRHGAHGPSAGAGPARHRDRGPARGVGGPRHAAAGARQSRRQRGEGHRAEVSVAAGRRGGTARITVADRGIGIPADQRRQVLSSFHRAHTGQGYAGIGLGLAIVQRVVDRHGGTIGIGRTPAAPS
ncbi:sensor histidine kinase [Dactylosporangium sp. CA-139114]|uniref:sensor histidine kinase n=1 Tax=Dactylosporangium sp. CA-139114 TaxID=3239931 RepID=UPI003D98283D